MSDHLAILDELARSAVTCERCFQGKDLCRSFVDIPQPRYIGPGYWQAQQKVAFVMLNPGAGTDEWRNRDWREHLIAFRDRRSSLADVFDAQRRHMPFWSGGRLIGFLHLHELDVDSAALINIAWCATAGNRYPSWMLNQCFALHTRNWLEELCPGFVILSGVASHAFEREVQMCLPESIIFRSFHYAHRPLDAKRAASHAEEIAQELARLAK